MITGMKRLQLISLAIIVAGLTQPKSADAAETGRVGDCMGCACCWNQCPGDLNQFCHDQGCSSQGSACYFMECEDTEGGFHDYDIECRAS